MKAIAVFVLFLGCLLVIQGIYAKNAACPEPKVEVKYIPRTDYEDQLSGEEKLQRQFQSMFDNANPWLERRY